MPENSKKLVPVLDLFTVSIFVGKTLYAYFPICSGHSEAMHMAASEHEEAGLPLPAGTRCIVRGRCLELSCGCGGLMRTRVFYILPSNGHVAVA